MGESTAISCALIQIIAQTPEKSIQLVRDTQSHQLMIRRILSGRQSIYCQLIGLTHPCLPAIFALNFTHGQTIILEELIEGCTLTQILLSEKALPANDIIHIGLALCQALTCLHTHGIIHRDIKPSNIMYSADNAIHLIDFDTAMDFVHDRSDSHTPCLGTKGYAPPEQYGFAPPDQRADIYALGKTLQELAEVSHCSRRFRHVISKCTAIDPQKRYASASHVAAALRRCRRPFQR